MKHIPYLTLALLGLSLIACQLNTSSGVCIHKLSDGSAQCHVNMDRKQCKRMHKGSRKGRIWIRQSYRTAIKTCQSKGFQYKDGGDLDVAVKKAVRNKTHITLHK